MRLYIDKECKLCRNFGEKIKNYEPKLEIYNYQKNEEFIKLEYKGRTYKKFEAIQKALDLGGEKNILLNVIASLPKPAQNVIYFLISKSRKTISYFLPS
jgi:predicted DCC family thiol-disulfide oxidoreductase YuxK